MDQDIPHAPNRKELLNMLDAMIESLDDMPIYARTQPITHYDLTSALLLISSIFKASD